MIDLEALAMTPEQVMALPRSEREDRVHALMREAFNLVDEGVSRHIVADLKRTAGVVILFSGGNDSTVLAHLFRKRATHAAHANTGVGVEQTREFVRKVCKAWNLPLLERKAPRKEDSYWHMVLERGFPGPGQHFKMFQRLKERALRVVRNEILAGRRDARVVFLAGRRRTESGRRANVPEFERQGSVVWISPLVNWTKPDLSMYRRMMGDVPRNEVSDLIHMSGECLCQPKGQLVDACDDGWVPIESVTRGMMVRGLTMQPEPVERTRSRSAKVIEIKGRYLLPMQLTADHPVWAREHRFRSHPYAQLVGDPSWVPAGDILKSTETARSVGVLSKRRHMICMPFETIEVPLRLSDEELRILGYFLAEGCYQWREGKGIRGIVFTIGDIPKSRWMERDIIRCMSAIGWRVGVRRYTDKRSGRKFVMIRSGAKAVSQFFQAHIEGRYCHEKRMKESLMIAPVEQQKVILDAMWCGDGADFVTARGGRCKTYSTTSPSMALQVQEMLLRAGKVYGVSSQFRKQTMNRPIYHIRAEGRSRSKMSLLLPGQLWVVVDRAKVVGRRKVYSLTVANDPTYRTGGGLVHNCGAFAHAGERGEIAAFFPLAFDEIAELEERLKDRTDLPDHVKTWGWGGDKASLAASRAWAKRPKSGKLCGTCVTRAEAHGQI